MCALVYEFKCMHERYSRGQSWAERPPAAVSEGGRRQVPVLEKH